ncbi:transposase [Streptomyces sp. NPDC102462]|uniref:transposase n=1 Tax=Streptomyces sp. NPDC102462 TaxID=3366178 RepID=UPI003824D904
MGSKYTKRYTEEFKRDAIALVDSSGKTVTAVARELGISSESLRGWYRRAKADRGEGESGELTSAEREELKRLSGRHPSRSMAWCSARWLRLIRIHHPAQASRRRAGCLSVCGEPGVAPALRQADGRSRQ